MIPMRRIKTKFGCLLLFISVLMNISFVHAYTAEEVFDQFKLAYEKSVNFAADFEETTIRNTNKGIARGRISFSKPNLLRQEYVSQEDPDNIVQLIILDGKFSWSYTPFLNQVNRMKIEDPKQKELIPGIGISLEGTEQNYQINLVLDEAAQKKDIYQLELKPKPHLIAKNDDGSSVSEVLEIWISAKDWLPVQFGYRSSNQQGDKMSVIVALKNIRRNKSMPAKAFRFEMPENVELVDLTEEN